MSREPKVVDRGVYCGAVTPPRRSNMIGRRVYCGAVAPPLMNSLSFGRVLDNEFSVGGACIDVHGMGTGLVAGMP